MCRFKTILTLSFLSIVLFSCGPNPRKSERMAAAMEQAKAVYGDGNLLMEIDTFLFIPGLAEASEYYAGKKQYDKAALASLYNGCVEKDFDKEEAMSSFKDAEYFGKIALDTLTTARAQYQIGRLMYYDGMFTEGIQFFHKADVGFKRNFNERALVQNIIGASYLILNEYDSAAHYLNQSLINATNCNSNLVIRKVLNNYAVFYEKTGAYDKAIDCLRRVIPENNEQRILNYLNLANIFSDLGDEDSANRYYNKVEDLIPLANVKKETLCVSFDKLSIWAERNNNLDLAIHYRKLHEEYLDAIRDQREQKTIYHIQQKYDSEATQNRLTKKIARKQRRVVLASLVSIVFLMGLALSQIKLARKRKQEVVTTIRMMDFMHRNETLTQSNIDYAKNLNKAWEKERKTMLLLDMYMKDPKTMSIKLLEAQVFGQKDHWKAIIEIVDKLYPGIWKTQLEMFPKLTDDEQRCLLLSHFSLTRQQEAILLGMTVNMVDKIRGRVRKKTCENKNNLE